MMIPKLRREIPSMIRNKSGVRYGRLLVIGPWRRANKTNLIEWLCSCDCGNEKWAKAQSLTSGGTKSCGCLNPEKTRRNYVGKKFGRLTAIERIAKGHSRTEYRCICDCGVELVVKSIRLMNNLVPSCGCFKREMASKYARLRWAYKPGEAAFNRVLERYKRTAKNGSRAFSLTEEEFSSICSSNCHYCGSKPSKVHKTGYGNGDFIYNGIDRMDNAKGYTIENSVPCCEPCNRAKLEMTKDDFLDLISRIYNHRILKEMSDSVNWNIA